MEFEARTTRLTLLDEFAESPNISVGEVFNIISSRLPNECAGQRYFNSTTPTLLFIIQYSHITPNLKHYNALEKENTI